MFPSASQARVEANILRDTWCMLGLPFDAVDMNQTINKVHDSIKNNTPCFISTPNLNFLIESQKDPAFKNSVISSDLNVADGKPLIWIARLLNIPLPERVAGSNLIEELIENKAKQTPIRVFFFGGEDGIAEIACNKLNGAPVGLECAGYLNPGFGAIKDMSSNSIVDGINRADAKFIIVSLGAKKGQEWVEKNRQKFNAPIISHLGAVVNFIAGTVNRSPKVMQKLGLEWMWRIKEEPILWKRYYKDAREFFGIFICRVIPLFFIVRFVDKKKNKSALLVKSDDKAINVMISGYCGKENDSELKKMFIRLVRSDKDIRLTFDKSAYVDSYFLAKLILLKKVVTDKKMKCLINVESKLVMRIFHYNCCDSLLN